MNGILTIHAAHKSRNQIKSAEAAIEICMLDLMVADKLFGHEYPVADVDVFRVRSVANSFNADANNTICINGWLLAMDS